MTARRYVVRGVVQGVGYRWFAVQEARALGARGWVRNRPDGTVEVLAEAPQAVLDALRAALRRGPRHAAVSAVEEHEAGEAAPPGEFDIRFS